VTLSCQKIITLDACHAAAADPNDPSERKGLDMIRMFTKGNVGPVIYAACRAEESAIEVPVAFVSDLRGHGLFAQAIYKTVADDFADSKKHVLDPVTMDTSVKANVASWVTALRKNPKNNDLSQNPQLFLPERARNLAILLGKD
jgi:hypothetical protein